MIRAAIIGAAFASAFGSVLATTPRAAELSGLFSSEVGGEPHLKGMEIAVYSTHRGVFVVVRCWGGTSGVPEVVAAEMSGGNISFVLADDTATKCDPGAYQGRLVVSEFVAEAGEVEVPGKVNRRLGRARSVEPAMLVYPYE